MPKILDSVITHINFLPPARATILGGFSFGALVAVFVAATLEAQNRAPSAVFLVDPPRIQLDPTRMLVRLARSHAAWAIGGILSKCGVLPPHSRWAKEARRRAIGARLSHPPHSIRCIFANQRYLPGTAMWAKSVLFAPPIIPLPTSNHISVVSDSSISALWAQSISQAVNLLPIL